MAFKDIKGIVVEIGGDTSGLQNALKKVNSATSSLSKELRGINSMLKLDPKNTDLLAQKQTVLKNNIKETTKYLDGLKGTQQEYIKSGGDLNSANYRSLQREIILTENKLKELKIEASNWTQVSKSLSGLSSKMKAVGDAVTNVGKKVIGLSAAVAGLFGAGVKYNAEIETTTKAFETFLGSAEEATKAIEAIKKQSETSPFDTKELIKANQYLITTGESADDSRKTISALADAISLTGGGNDELNRMASNLQQIRNAGKATSMDIRQFAYAGIDVYGILAETTGKNIDELKKMDITYEDLSQALIQASSEGGKYYNGQSKMADTLNGKISTLKKTFQDLLGELSETLMPIIDKIIGKVQEFVSWIKGLDESQKELITKIGLFVVALGPALVIIGKVISFGGAIFGVLSKITGIIATLSSSVGGMSAVLTALTGPVGIAIAVIGALIAAFVLLWNKSETFRNSMKEIGASFVQTYNEHIKPTIDNLKEIFLMIWNDVLQPTIKNISEAFGPILEKVFVVAGQTIASLFDKLSIIVQGITGVLKGLIQFINGVFAGDWGKAWEGIKTIFGSVFEGLKSLFKAPINWIISKLNSFISGINKIQIPDWVPGIGGKGINIPQIPQLAKGGIVDSATLAMIGEGRSAEAVIPLDRTLAKYMAEALKIAGGNRNIVMNFYPQQMTEAELERAFNYVDRRFGVLY